MVRFAAAPYAEREAAIPGAFDLRATAAWGTVLAHLPRPASIAGHARQIRGIAAEYEGWSDASVLAEAGAIRQGLLRTPDALRSRVFALVYTVVERHLGLRYHPVQLAGGRVLTGRRVAEMATGEGKTITAVLPAAAAALAGQAVHIVTVNDYLAKRDAERLRPVFAALGLTVGLVQGGDETPARRAAYTADITYVTNKEVAFDYLKDRIATTQARSGARLALSAALGAPRDKLILRGLQTAIVDEADSVLVDEARTPLIISAERPNPALNAIAGRALAVANSLQTGADFVLDETRRVVQLTAQGQAAIGERLEGGEGLFRARFAREQITTQALTALHLFARDRHYIVQDGTVQIVDEYTGRVMPDRTWEEGLHQMVEAKEGLLLSGARDTLARITYQRFFNRYMNLSGMTGTGREVAGELRAVYGLRVTRLPPNRKLLRQNWGGTLLPRADAKWEDVARRAGVLQRKGRPVLVGTQSVEASEALSAVLDLHRLPHVVLNARQDADEAAIVGEAGAPGRITVATNMAGRGTDIGLAPGVADGGGLHVILTEFSDSRRIDRQLFGRAGRQGEPGSFESVVALDDGLFQRFGSRLARVARALPGWLALPLLRLSAQSAASRSNAGQRRRQILADEHMEQAMGFVRKE